MIKVRDEFVHRLFYPQVPLILSATWKSRTSAMPVVSYTSVSDHPPMVAVSCSPKGFTCKLAARAKAFSLCLLDEGKAESVAKLATISGAEVRDKLAEVGLSYKKGTRTGAPVINGAAAVIECSLKSKIATGDHVLLLGEVKAAKAAKAFDEFWNFKTYKPLLYTGWKEGLTTYP